MANDLCTGVKFQNCSNCVKNHSNVFLLSQGFRKCIVLHIYDVPFSSYEQKNIVTQGQTLVFGSTGPKIKNAPILTKLVSKCSSWQKKSNLKWNEVSEMYCYHGNAKSISGPIERNGNYLTLAIFTCLTFISRGSRLCIL